MTVSNRSTTSSRKPGKAIEGSVTIISTKLKVCPDCGGIRRVSFNPHAPRWIAIKGGYVKVDCAGRFVP